MPTTRANLAVKCATHSETDAVGGADLGLRRPPSAVPWWHGTVYVTALFAWAGESTWAVSLYVIAVCVVSFVSIVLATETPMLSESYDKDSEQRASPSGPS